MRRHRGFSLVELLIAMIVFLLVLVGTVAAITRQSRGFSKGADEMGVLQNLRYGVDQLQQELRVAGANVPTRQPVVVYAGTNAFSFNGDLVSNTVGDISAVYVDVSAPDGQVSSLPLANAITIPGSSPGFTYPLFNFSTSAAETITFWFTADAETVRDDDFVLMRQANNQAAEPLVRNILAPAGGVPFFQYSYQHVPVAGNQTLQPVPAAWLPLQHSAPRHGVLPDIGNSARVDSIRTVTVNYRVTNGQTGAAEQVRTLTAIIPLPNAGAKKLQTCGEAPIFGQAVGAVATLVSGSPRVDVTWNASVDEASGETDVIRYVIWRRVGGAGAWGDPVASIASGASPYVFADADVLSGLAYQYSVAAQDCTPSLSASSLSATVAVP
jgi:prepilin-type N-terminal cleavage/methylation domain-containing protein